MPKRSRIQILADKLERLEAKREDRINRYIINLEAEISETRDKIRAYYQKKGIKMD